LAGLPTDRFLFAGFLPAKAGARAAAIAELGAVRATLVFYESGGRTGCDAWPKWRSCSAIGPAAVAREISKRFEETVDGSLESAGSTLRRRRRHAAKSSSSSARPARPLSVDDATLDTALARAMAVQPMKPAVAEVVELLGLPRNRVYARALELRDASN
jgi:16S rRNA (cytidine1402-2'-O)-methyltransferase